MRLLKTHNFLFSSIREKQQIVSKSIQCEDGLGDIISICQPWRYYMKMIDFEVVDVLCENRELHSSRLPVWRQPLQTLPVTNIADWYRRRALTPKCGSILICAIFLRFLPKSRQRSGHLKVSESGCVRFVFLFLFRIFQFDALFASKINFVTIWFFSFGASKCRNLFTKWNASKEFYFICATVESDLSGCIDWCTEKRTPP